MKFYNIREAKQTIIYGSKYGWIDISVRIN